MIKGIASNNPRLEDTKKILHAVVSSFLPPEFQCVFYKVCVSASQRKPFPLLLK